MLAATGASFGTDKFDQPAALSPSDWTMRRFAEKNPEPSSMTHRSGRRADAAPERGIARWIARRISCGVHFTHLAGIALFVAANGAAVQAAEFNWPGRGVVVVDVPQNWALRGQSAPNAIGYSLRGEPKSGPQALLQITIMTVPAKKPIRADSLRDDLHHSVQAYLDDSVEKKFEPQPLQLRTGTGWYVQLTDASLVGKPPVRGDFKVMRCGLAALDDRTLAVITLQFDEPKPAAAQLLAVAESLRVQPVKSREALQIDLAGGCYVLHVGVSRLTVRIPQGTLVARNSRLGGGTDNPRYFEFGDTKSGLIVSGWFESESRYGGIRKLWRGDTAAWKRTGQPTPVNVQFAQRHGWDIVTYDLPIPRVSNSHVRAERAGGGTWLDLHASITSDKPIETLRADLLAFLDSVVVEAN